MNRAIDIAALASIASMLLYAFTGVAVWSPLQPGDDARVMFLCFAHGIPIVVAFFRRQ